MYKPTALEVVAEGEEGKFYWLHADCSNCGLSQSLAFKKGDVVSIHACPNCGNTSLHKKERIEI